MTPVMMVDGSSAYNDVAAAAYLFAVFYLAETKAPPRTVLAFSGVR